MGWDGKGEPTFLKNLMCLCLRELGYEKYLHYAIFAAKFIDLVIFLNNIKFFNKILQLYNKILILVPDVLKFIYLLYFASSGLSTCNESKCINTIKY